MQLRDRTLSPESDMQNEIGTGHEHTVQSDMIIVQLRRVIVIDDLLLFIY